MVTQYQPTPPNRFNTCGSSGSPVIEKAHNVARRAGQVLRASYGIFIVETFDDIVGEDHTVISARDRLGIVVGH
jgi:hypothetical protein